MFNMFNADIYMSTYMYYDAVSVVLVTKLTNLLNYNW